MSILGVNSALAGAYQYANRTQKTGTNRTGFTEQLQKTGEAADTSKVDAYTEYLRSKYGNVRIQSIGKDQKSLDRAGKSMSGSDVVIAPNILEQMANDPEKAKYLEENLAALPDCAKSAVSSCRGTLTNLSYSVDANGNISVAISGTSDPDGKIAKENAERRAKEKKAAEEKAAERRKGEKGYSTWIMEK